MQNENHLLDPAPSTSCNDLELQPSPGAGLRRSRWESASSEPATPERLAAVAPRPQENPLLPGGGSGDAFNLHGRFAEDGRAFVQTDARTPRPWNSFLWNESFIASCSHVGQGYALHQDPRGLRLDLHEGRGLWLVDAESGEAWSANGLPLPPEDEPFVCTHAIGSVCIEREHGGILSRLEIGVPEEGARELWRLTVTNTGKKERRLRAIPFVECAVGGVFPAATAGRYRKEYRAATVTDIVRTGSHLAHFTDGVVHGAFLLMDREPSGFDTRRSAFVGPYGNAQAPAAIREHGGCTGSLCDYERPVLALETPLVLAGGATETIGIVTGLFSAEAELRDAARTDVQKDLEKAVAAAIDKCGTWEVETPQKDVDAFLGGFLQHQLRLNASWARVYYNGIRDLAQDNAALAVQDPAQAWKKFRQVLSFQYASGYAPRAWIGGGVVEQDYSDSPVWLPMAAHAIVMETGDTAVLEEEVPFYDGPAAPAYEHLRRSLRHLWKDRGRHGLSKIHRGDWNDLLNAAGREGKGESVWLSQALCVALDDFSGLAAVAGHGDDAAWARRCRLTLLRAIRRHAFDPAHGIFIRGFTDGGEPLHSVDSGEGIDLIVQAWGVLSGAVEGAEARRVLEMMDRRLELAQGTLTMERGFDHYRPEIGFLSATRPGCNVNAGFYQHAAAFAVVADCVAGRGDAAWRRLRKLLPFTPERGHIHGEPFVVNNAYYGPASGYRQGQSEMGWLTGTAGWITRAVTRHVFGLKPVVEGLVLDPCLPSGWEHAAISRRFRGASYHIAYRQSGCGDYHEIREVHVDGTPWGGGVLPWHPGGTYQVVAQIERSKTSVKNPRPQGTAPKNGASPT
ncbi:MAG: hypothetical protein WC003_13315 [Terrimicrobiaceae bacterium]